MYGFRHSCLPGVWCVFRNRYIWPLTLQPVPLFHVCGLSHYFCYSGEVRHLPEDKPVLQIENLRKSYASDSARVDVLKGLSVTVMQGEVVGVVGASGVGKTTFLHIIGTLDRPCGGRVLHFGQDVFEWPDSRLSRFRNSDLGFVFQFHHLLPEFSALENVMMPCLVAGSSRSEARLKASDILERLGLASRESHRTGQLSGGEQQRVALARAMVQRPRLLLADEPTGNLDEKTGEHVADLIFSLNRQYGTTVIIVTHNLTLARRMDRCIGIHEGTAVELTRDDLVRFGVGAV